MSANLPTQQNLHKQVLSLTWTERRFYIALVKRRNQLLALFCLVVFFAFGVFYFRTWVVQKPFGIILFVGEGLDANRLAAARVYAAGAETPLTIDSLPYTALLKNYTKDFATPDQAAAATALATGVKVKNGAIGTDAEGKALTNIIELARQSGRMTGLITNGLVTDITPASFYAHPTGEYDRAELARFLVENASIDVVLGGGAEDFLPTDQDGKRSDGRDLLQEIPGTGYDLVQTLEDLEAVPRWRAAKVFGLFSRSELAFSTDEEGRGAQPTLSDLVRRGIELLQFNSGGYLLVVDAALMGRKARVNNAKATLAETADLDRAVSVAIHYAGTKAMIIVCGDVGIGGLNINGFGSYAEKGAAAVPSSPDAGAFVTWATGLTGSKRAVPPQEGSETANDSAEFQGPELESNDPVAVPAPFAQNTLGDVPAFGTGLGADLLQGTLESTAVFDIIRDNL